MDKPIPDWLWQGLEESERNKKIRLHGDQVKYDWVGHREQPCEACAEPVVDRRVTARRTFSPIPHWRVKCETCGLYYHYDEDEFRDFSSNLSYFYNKRFSKD